jgi:hypothetical protein
VSEELEASHWFAGWLTHLNSGRVPRVNDPHRSPLGEPRHPNRKGPDRNEWSIFGKIGSWTGYLSIVATQIASDARRNIEL